nr:IPExxxVDY family protein [Bacteroidota bacterium]
MKKKKLTSQVEQHRDFVVYDLATILPDFQLAYFLNKHLDFKLEKEKNFEIYLPPKNQPESFSLYHCKIEKSRAIYLISNARIENTLMRSFFLIFQGFYTTQEQEKLLHEISNISQVLNFNIIDLTEDNSKKAVHKRKLGQINAILTDLEYHMIEVNRHKNQSNTKLNQSKSVTRKIF